MDDLISRKAAIAELDHAAWGKEYDKALAKAMLESLPTAQPEIIRCKACKFCDRGIDEDGNPFLKCLGWVYGGTQEEDFCSHAERRAEKEEVTA